MGSFLLLVAAPILNIAGGAVDFVFCLILGILWLPIHFWTHVNNYSPTCKQCFCAGKVEENVSMIIFCSPCLAAWACVWLLVCPTLLLVGVPLYGLAQGFSAALV